MKTGRFILYTVAVILYLVFAGTAFAYARIISNIISTNVVVNHVLGEPVLTSFLYNDKDLGITSTHFTPAVVNGYLTTIDLRQSTANSIKTVMMRASTSSSLNLMLPEFGNIDMGSISQSKTGLVDLSLKKPESDLEGDGIKLITMERLAAEDSDGDDTVLTIPGTLYDSIFKVTGNIEIKVQLPKVAAAWGDNSHIKNAVYNYNNSGKLFLPGVLKGQTVVLNILARSNCSVPHVHYVVADTSLNSERIITTTQDFSINPGADVSISIPVTFDIDGSYYLRVYPVIGQ